ncbi:hypothetical protein KNE206_78230 [Kitasatospora sp. NE20-6]
MAPAAVVAPSTTAAVSEIEVNGRVLGARAGSGGKTLRSHSFTANKSPTFGGPADWGRKLIDGAAPDAAAAGSHLPCARHVWSRRPADMRLAAQFIAGLSLHDTTALRTGRPTSLHAMAWQT